MKRALGEGGTGGGAGGRLLRLALGLGFLAPASIGRAAPEQPLSAAARNQAEALLAPILKDKALAKASIGLVVQRLSDQAVLFAHRPDGLLVPASNVKLVTTATALTVLGPDYQFATEVYGNLTADGRVEGDLFVKGYGDPYLVPERLWQLACRLRFLGISQVSGGLVVDDSFFAGESRAFGWTEDSSTNAYMAPAGALSASFNALMVHMLPGAQVGEDARVLIEPESAYAPVVGRISTVAQGRTQVTADVESRNGHDVVRVGGQFVVGDMPRGVWRRINEPARFAGELLRTQLGQMGVPIRGQVTRGEVPTLAPKLLRFISPRLAEVIGPLNKYSNNFMAAQLAYTLGAEVHGAPGTWAKGKQVIDTFLQGEVGLKPGSYSLRNASGLHEVNLFTPRQLADLVGHVAQTNRVGPEFINSLATAAGIGTLQDRMHDGPAAHQLRAKTGTLSGASALSGLVPTRDGTMLTFSIIVNGFRRVDSVWAVQDRMAHVLAGLDLTQPELSETSSKFPAHR